MAPKTGSAVVVRAFNATEPTKGVALEQREVPDPAEGQVRVALRLAAVNPSDMFAMTGMYPNFTSELPGVLGSDGMGVVEAVGAGVIGLAPGQRVTSLGWDAKHGEGCWQQYVVMPAADLVPLPDAISDEAGAQFYVNPLTVIGLLEVAAVPQGEYLLVTAAGSTLSKMMIAVAKAQGVKTIGTVRRQEQVAEIAALRADAVVCTGGGTSLPEEVARITGGKGAYAVVDSIAGDMVGQLVNCLRQSGSLVLYGAMGGLDVKFNVLEAIFRDVRIMGFNLAAWLEGKTPSQRQATVEATLDLMVKGVMAPESGKVFPLAQWGEAVAASVADARGGKVLLDLSA